MIKIVYDKSIESNQFFSSFGEINQLVVNYLNDNVYTYEFGEFCIDNGGFYIMGKEYMGLYEDEHISFASIDDGKIFRLNKQIIFKYKRCYNPCRAFCYTFSVPSDISITYLPDHNVMVRELKFKQLFDEEVKPNRYSKLSIYKPSKI